VAERKQVQFQGGCQWLSKLIFISHFRPGRDMGKTPYFSRETFRVTVVREGKQQCADFMEPSAATCQAMDD